jgi:hypothetical protein
MQAVARVAKALTAAVGAAGAAAVTAAQDGEVTAADWVTILVALVTVGVATWGVPNASVPPAG